MYYRFFIGLIIWGKVGWVLAQPTSVFRAGQVQAELHSNGVISNVLIPADSNKKAFDNILLWIGGKNAGNVFVAANHSVLPGSDFYPGVLRVNDATADDTAKWNKVFTITKEEIQHHIANYNKPNYVMSPHINEWPGSGGNGFADVVAPYIDFDQNGTYNPEAGDAPYIDAVNAKGKKASCVVFNDKYAAHAVSGSAPLGAEILLLVTEYEDQPANTLFLTYYIHNRTAMIYDSTYVGLWADFAIGRKGNEFVSTDSLRNFYFAYNDTNFMDSLPTGFGAKPPATGIVFLNKPLQYTITTDTTNLDHSITGTPSQPFHFYNFTKRYWKDNTRLNLGVNGWSTGTPANFIYNGDPCDPTGWTEEVSSLAAGAKKMIGSMGPFSFKKNEALVLKAALVWARGNGSTHSVCVAKDKADEVRTFYQQRITGIQKPALLPLDIYPNPTTDKLHLNYENLPGASIRVYDISGKCLMVTQGHDIDVSTLSEGIYYLHLITEKGEARTRFIKTR